MDTENHPCLRCEAKFKSVSCLKQHLMTVHNALVRVYRVWLVFKV